MFPQHHTGPGEPGAAEGEVDATDAVILWDESAEGIRNVSVARFPASRLAPEDPAWVFWRGLAGHWDYAFGSVSPLWLSSETAQPEAVFAYFVLTDFSSEAEEARAWAAFARIRECGWAREGTGLPAPGAQVAQRPGVEMRLAHALRRLPGPDAPA
jgi:hypothetical protein